MPTREDAVHDPDMEGAVMDGGEDVGDEEESVTQVGFKRDDAE